MIHEIAFPSNLINFATFNHFSLMMGNNNIVTIDLVLVSRCNLLFSELLTIVLSNKRCAETCVIFFKFRIVSMMIKETRIW